MRMLRLVALLVAVICVASLARAVEPDEILADAALEQRARAISAELRCMVCQNQSIDDSDADLAKDLRILVRERLVAGDTDRQVIDFVVARYGEFVLLRPRFSARNALLWAAPLLLLLAGGAFILFRGRGPAREAATLTEDERRRIEELLRDKP